MPYTPEQKRAQRLRQKRLAIDKAHAADEESKHTRRFLAIDGEGGGNPHEYTLIVAAGSGYKAARSNRGGPLSARMCFDFILSLPKERTLVSFFFNYDVTMMLKGWDREWLLELRDRDSRTAEDGSTEPVHWQGYDIDWIPGKLFTVAGYHGNRWQKRTVYDSAGFFQTSFVNALEGWNVGNARERRFIQEMKGRRSDFTGEVSPEVIEYAQTECVLLTKLMDLVYQETLALGFTLTTFSGAGSLASAMMTQWGISDYIGELPTEVESAAWGAYFGGRFETAVVGEIPRRVWEYDINSAYPAALQRLPGLKRGKWVHHGYGWKPPRDSVCVSRVRWCFNPSMLGGTDGEHRPTYHFGPLPVRLHNKIVYPWEGEGWYWEPEFRAVWDSKLRTNHYANRMQTLESWEWIPEDPDELPFSHIPELYERRKELKAKGHLGEKVIKLGLNSLYGKTAQTVGKRQFASPVWAGMITSTARAMLFRAIDESVGDYLTEDSPPIVMTATDALYSLRPLKLEQGDGLGQWERNIHSNMFIVQPGVYALDYETEQVKRKTRGVRKVAFNVSDTLAAWRADGINATIRIPVHTFIGLGRGVISKEYRPGMWVDEFKTVSFKTTSKRYPDLCIDGYLGLYWLQTPVGIYLRALYPKLKEGDTVESEPYSPKALEVVKLRRALEIDLQSMPTYELAQEAIARAVGTLPDET